MQSYNISLLNEALGRDGYIVVHSNEVTEKKILDIQIKLSSALGELSEHNPGKKDYLWKIASSPSSSELITYSEHNSEAELHTDSQYRMVPEQFFSLSCVNEATCGGGMSILLDSNKILTTLKEEIPTSHFKALHSNFPIIIPDVFREPNSTHISTPIFGKQVQFRFRYDTILKGLKKLGYTKNSIEWEAFDMLWNHICKSEHIETFYLKKGDILFIDNHRMLHGRTAFTDSNRLLYRIRFNKS